MDAKLNKNWNLEKCIYESLLMILKMGLIKEEMFKDKDINQILDLRDEKTFDEKWIEIYNNLERFEIKFDEKELITEIRKEAFLSTVRLSGSSDLAEYVSDDFELFCKAIELDYDSNWLNGVFSLLSLRTDSLRRDRTC